MNRRAAKLSWSSLKPTQALRRFCIFPGYWLVPSLVNRVSFRSSSPICSGHHHTLSVSSEIRETIVKLMTIYSTRRKQITPRGCNGENETSPWFTPDKDSGPSTCAFWSAIAIGALLQGRPKESVSPCVCVWTDARIGVRMKVSTVQPTSILFPYTINRCNESVHVLVRLCTESHFWYLRATRDFGR